MRSKHERLRTVVVLGGYGRTGRALSRQLRLSSDMRVVIAGPRIDQARACAARLEQESGRGEVLARYANAGVPETIGKAIEDADLLAIAAPVERHLRDVALACLAQGCGYVDILGSNLAACALTPLEAEIVRAGRLFVVQAGLCPGLSSAAVKYLLGALEGCRSIRLGVRIGLKGFDRPEQVYGFVDAAAENRPMIYRGGSWRRVSRRAERREIDYGASAGPLVSIPFDLPELHGLAERSGLQELGAYGATPNWLADCALRNLLAVMYRIHRGLGRRAVASALLRAGARSRAAGGATLVAQGWNDTAAILPACSLRISHCDGFALTALSAAFVIRQYLAGEFRSMSGVRPMGHIVDAGRVLRELSIGGVDLQATGCWNAAMAGNGRGR